MRSTPAILAALVIAVLAGCSPDIVPVAGPNPPRPARDVTSVVPTLGLCGDDPNASDHLGRLLSPIDVWPRAAYSGQGAQNYTLDPAACQARLVATPAPLVPNCAADFPYFEDDDLVTEMARLGVVHIAETQDMDMRADGGTVSEVDEVLLDLGVTSAPKIAALATGCGATRAAGHYTSTSGSGSTTVLQIESGFAVVVTFDRRVTLTAAQRATVLKRAVTLGGT
jgi:hypothetical protein